MTSLEYSFARQFTGAVAEALMLVMLVAFLSIRFILGGHRLCLPPVEPLQPTEIKHIRESTRVSQAVFAVVSREWPRTLPPRLRTVDDPKYHPMPLTHGTKAA